MPDYPYRMTLVMTNPLMGWTHHNVNLAAWLNAQVPDTVPADLGPPLSLAGVGEPTHHWASSAAQAASTYQIMAHLAEIADLTPPPEATWDGWTLAERLTWANTTLNAAMDFAYLGGVLLEDSATNTNPAALLSTVDFGPLLPLLPSLPAQESQQVVWRVRADKGNFEGHGGQGFVNAPGMEANRSGYWEDLGPAKVSARQTVIANQPLWTEDRINGHPAVVADGTDSMATPAPVAHGIGAGPFSLYCVVRFAAFVSTSQGIWDCGGNAFGFGTRIQRPTLRLEVYDAKQFDTELAVNTWYYLLITRSPGNLLRCWVNGYPDPRDFTGVSAAVPDGVARLFVAEDESDLDCPMNGEIAEFGFIAQCVETTGQKTALDNEIYTRYGLG